MRYVGVGPRAAAAFIDGIVAGIPLAILVGLLTGQTYSGNGSAGVDLNGWGTLIWALAMVGYYTVVEVVWGTSLGKRILNLRVRTEDGGEVDVPTALARNLARFVDGFPYVIPYMLGAVLVARDEKKRRLGDRFARTVVVYRD
jgi:uncharacterized RDD family membrane protein YckC